MNGSVPPPEDLEDLDPALARERTLLAWNRTGLAFLAVGGFVIKTVPLAGSALLAIGGLVWLLGYAHMRTSRAKPTPRWLDRTRLFRVITAGTLIASTVALAIALVQEGNP